MNEEKLPTGEGEELEPTEPDTNTDADLEEEEPAQPAFPVAAPALEDEERPAPAEPPAPPAAPPGPRVFPQHYKLILGSGFVLASGFAVWERAEIFDGGVKVSGGDSVAVAFLAGLAFYSLAVGIANVATGRLRGMGLTFLTGVAGLYLGIKGIMSTWEQKACMGWSQMEEHLKATTGSNLKLLLNKFLGQWAPGVWLATIGGAIIVLVFLKAVFGGGKKKEAAPAPAPARRRGRR